MKQTLIQELQKIEHEIFIKLDEARSLVRRAAVLLSKEGETNSPEYKYFSLIHKATNNITVNMAANTPMNKNPIHTESTKEFMERNSFEDPFRVNQDVKNELLSRAGTHK